MGYGIDLAGELGQYSKNVYLSTKHAVLLDDQSHSYSPRTPMQRHHLSEAVSMTVVSDCVKLECVLYSARENTAGHIFFY